MISEIYIAAYKRFSTASSISYDKIHTLNIGAKRNLGTRKFGEQETTITCGAGFKDPPRAFVGSIFLRITARYLVGRDSPGLNANYKA